MRPPLDSLATDSSKLNRRSREDAPEIATLAIVSSECVARMNMVRLFLGAADQCTNGIFNYSAPT